MFGKENSLFVKCIKHQTKLLAIALSINFFLSFIAICAGLSWPNGIWKCKQCNWNTFRFIHAIGYYSVHFLCLLQNVSPQSPPQTDSLASQINPKKRILLSMLNVAIILPCIRLQTKEKQKHMDSTERKQILFYLTDQKAFILPLFHFMSLSFFLSTHHFLLCFERRKKHKTGQCMIVQNKKKLN